MVAINPINVLNLLMTVFTAMNIPQTPVNKAEVGLKERIQEILIESMENYNMQIEDENVLVFDSFNDINDAQQVIEDRDIPEGLIEDTEVHCPLKDDVDYDYKLEAVNYWTSGKKGYLKLETVKNKYRKVTSKTQLHRWAKHIEERGTCKEKLAEITEFVINQARTAIDNKLPLHDIDIRRWAIQARNDKNLSPQLFKASHSWVQRFKKANRLVSRKITKFVSQKQIGNIDRIKTLAMDFVKEAKQQIQVYGPENTYNSDQSGFNLEFHSGRTLSDIGVKTVENVVQSVSSTTHSYTIQPIISAEGKLLSPLLIVLKESSGMFGPRVINTMFKADNIYVLASKSGKLTSDHMKNWLQNIYFPNTGSKSLLLLDSWSGHCPEVISEVTPSDTNFKHLSIPPGTTGQIQPLDVFGFRIWKNFIRRFSDQVILYQYDVNLHQRDNILKLQSLTHNQLSSPRFINVFKYAWFASGYIEERPDHFENPVEFCFSSERPTCDICGDVAVVTCAWCKKTLCLKHFFHDFHFCQLYVE